MKNIPKKIYLQIGEDCDAEDFEKLVGVSWSEDRINNNDIEYKLVEIKQSEEDDSNWGLKVDKSKATKSFPLRGTVFPKESGLNPTH